MNKARKLVSNQEVKKDKAIKTRKILLTIQKILNMAELTIPIISLITCVVSILYLFQFQNNEQIAGILDFLIAALSSAVLIASIVHNKLSDTHRYILMQMIYVLIMLVGFVIILIVGMKLKNPSVIGRALSFLCLSITLILEIVKAIRHDCGTNKESEKRMQNRIEKMEKSSIMAPYDK